MAFFLDEVKRRTQGRGVYRGAKPGGGAKLWMGDRQFHASEKPHSLQGEKRQKESEKRRTQEEERNREEAPFQGEGERRSSEELVACAQSTRGWISTALPKGRRIERKEGRETHIVGADKPIPRPAGAPKPGPAASCTYMRVNKWIERGGVKETRKRTPGRESASAGGGPSTVDGRDQYALSVITGEGKQERTGQSNNRLSPQDHQPQRPLHLILLLLVLPVLVLRPSLPLNPPKLVRLTQDQVHVLVEREELSDEGTRIVEDYADAVVDDGGEFAAARFGLEGVEGESGRRWRWRRRRGRGKEENGMGRDGCKGRLVLG